MLNIEKTYNLPNATENERNPKTAYTLLKIMFITYIDRNKKQGSKMKRFRVTHFHKSRSHVCVLCSERKISSYFIYSIYL